MSKSIAHSRRGIVIGGLRFNPGLIPTVATVLMFALLMNLGFWQLRRAELKEHMVERLEGRSQQTSRDLNTLSPTDMAADMTDYPLHVTGHYLNDLSLLLDNRPYHGQPGYEVLTAFLKNGINQVYLVVPSELFKMGS